MTTEQLLAAYPAIPHAIAWVELMLCPSSLDDENGFGELLQSGMSPDNAIATLKYVVEDSIREFKEVAGSKTVLARAEMDHPEFRQYVLGKMGCM